VLTLNWVLLTMAGLNIKEELAFYGAYHSNFENQVIHIIFVPMLLWSAFVIISIALHRNLSFLAWLAYAIFYFFLDPVVGSAASAFYFVLWYTADMLVTLQRRKAGAKAVPVLPKGTALLIALLAQVVGWSAQGRRFLNLLECLF